MKIKLKHYLFTAFREIFLYHYNSLEFRAKVFAAVLAANDDVDTKDYEKIRFVAQDIYEGNEDRISSLTLATMEYVKKVHDDNGYNLDHLIHEISRDIKMMPRYAKKIDSQKLMSLLDYEIDPDSLSYQIRIVEFLEELKKDYSDASV